MLRQDYIFTNSGKRRGRRASNQTANLENIHKKNGYYDGKIFYSVDKVTLTFVHQAEVVVLHLDLDRRALFLKGHRVTSLDFHPDLTEFLGRFRKCLDDNINTKGFLKTFDAVVASFEDPAWKSNP